MQNPVQEKIKAAGGQTAVANALGVPVTTVHAWSVKGRVPHWRAADFDRVVDAVAQPAPQSAAA